MELLLLHLSDAHFKNSDNPLLKKQSNIASVVATEAGPTTEAIFICFTGDAVDKGNAAGFPLAKQFLKGLCDEIAQKTKLTPSLLAVPGNHDVVQPADPSLRDIAIQSIKGNSMANRLQPAVESAVLAPLNAFFAFADELMPGNTLTSSKPFYHQVNLAAGNKIIRFHLLNSSWMCAPGQSPGALLFPISELPQPDDSHPADYEIALIHHPFAWFKQPEAMRPIRESLESICDMILTGHEHVGRSLKTSEYSGPDIEYHEGDALQEGNDRNQSGFHVLKLDFSTQRQIVSTYTWDTSDAVGYKRKSGTIESALGRNLRSKSRPYRLDPSFITHLDDPELPVIHQQHGKLRLSDFYTYPDIKPVRSDPDSDMDRIKGEDVVAKLRSCRKSLLFGPDRSGKSSFTKLLVKNLHERGDLPLLLKGSQLKNRKTHEIPTLLAKCITEQYETLSSEVYFQVGHPRVLVIDDFHVVSRERSRRSVLLAALEKSFDRITIVGADELYFEDIVASQGQQSDADPLWSYDHFQLLPFGYQRCENFVRKWVSLGNTPPDDVEEKATQINSVVTHFLRNNLIPSYPWVVMVIVQQADSAEPLHAENGSYGFLLQSLITAALAKSRLKLPINGKYAWLGEFANELHSRDVGFLSDQEAKAFHERHRREYGLHDADYKEVRDDLIAAGVLYLDGGDLSFRQAYTYCYFVAWHLAQRIHSNDPTARDEVKRLCRDLYHEDTANVLVFLAHLTTSHVVLEEMTSRAAELFSTVGESDMASDAEIINNLYSKVQSLILPGINPVENKANLNNERDDEHAARATKSSQGREVRLRPSPPDRAQQDEVHEKIMQLVTSKRTIEILGQILRNEATARKVDAMLNITEHVFRLGRRVLAVMYASGGKHLTRMVEALGAHYKSRMPEARAEELVEEVSRHLFNIYVFASFGLVKIVAQSVGEKNLREVFRRLVESDNNLANRIYKLAIDLETASKLPINDVESLNEELSGRRKAPDGTRSYNNLAHTVVRALVVDYLYLNHVPQQQVQSLCQKLKIEVPAAVANPGLKRLPPPSNK